MYKSYGEAESKISKEFKELRKTQPKETNTLIAKEFLRGRMHSWQAHLQRISPFLEPGIGVWWEDYYEFLDGSDEPNFKQQEPNLQHYRDTRLEQVYDKNKAFWEHLIQQESILPTPYVKLFDGLWSVYWQTLLRRP